MRYVVQLIGARWAVGYVLPGTVVFAPVLDCPSQAAAEREAKRLNAEVASA